MKRLVYLLIAVSLMLALVPAVALAHTEDDPLVVDLLAGQHTDVGDVLVWNDAGYLYVRFVTDGTCMTETHLHVATSPDDIPQKNGNPIPGKFTYSEEHGCATDYTYPGIPLQWDYGTPLYIAAHAALGAEETMTFYSDGGADTLVTAGNVVDATYPYPAVDTWEAFDDPPDTTPSYWEQRLTYNGSPFSFSAMADWIWESYRVVDPTTTQDVTFEHAFTVNGYPTSGKLYIATDNMYSVSLNGVSVGEHTDWMNWQIVGGYDIYPVEGTNVLQIIGSNYGDSNYNLDNNPAGLIFEAEITYLIPGETAWGAGFDFSGKNWATYIEYTVQGEILEKWPEGGTLTVAYEDLPMDGGNDWDYNDWVADIDTLATFWGTSTERDLVQMDFTVRPEAKMAGYTHVMHLDANTFACNGIYELYRDGSLVESGNYSDGTGIDVVLVPNTGSAPNEVLLTISFTGDCVFSLPEWDQSLYHGENLFYDPYLHVNDTGEDIHTDDVRMLTVPVDWQWPAEDQAIWLAYPKVTAGSPPTFQPYWWTP